MYLADYPALSFHLYVDTSGSDNPRGGVELARKGLINIRNINQLAINCLVFKLFNPILPGILKQFKVQKWIGNIISRQELHQAK